MVGHRGCLLNKAQHERALFFLSKKPCIRCIFMYNKNIATTKGNNNMSSNVTYYRVTTADTDNFSREGDTIAIKQGYDTDTVYNLTTNKQYTRGNEQGTVITDINTFPMFDSEKENLQKLKLSGRL